MIIIKIIAVLLVVTGGLLGCTKSDGQAPSQQKKETSNASKVYDQLPDSSPRLK